MKFKLIICDNQSSWLFDRISVVKMSGNIKNLFSLGMISFPLWQQNMLYQLLKMSCRLNWTNEKLYFVMNEHIIVYCWNTGNSAFLILNFRKQHCLLLGPVWFPFSPEALFIYMIYTHTHTLYLINFSDPFALCQNCSN